MYFPFHFSYLFSNCFEITLELSCCKYPNRSELSNEWNKNVKSLVRYLQATHLGIKGVISDSNNNPLKDFMISVEGIDKPINATNRGEYWRLLMPGNYQVKAWSSDGKYSKVLEVSVPTNQTSAVRLDFVFDLIDSPQDDDDVTASQVTTNKLQGSSGSEILSSHASLFIQTLGIVFIKIVLGY